MRPSVSLKVKSRSIGSVPGAMRSYRISMHFEDVRMCMLTANSNPSNYNNFLLFSAVRRTNITKEVNCNILNLNVNILHDVLYFKNVLNMQKVTQSAWDPCDK